MSFARWILLLCVFAASIGLFPARATAFESPTQASPQGSPLEGVPAGSPFTVGVRGLESLLQLIMAQVEATPELREPWQEIRREMREELGFDLTTVEGRARLGLDLNAPVHVSMLQLSNYGPSFMISARVKDRIALLEFLLENQRLFGELQKISGWEADDAPIYLWKRGPLATIRNGRFYLAVGDRMERQLGRFESYLDVGVDQPLALQDDYKAALEKLDTTHPVTGYVDFRQIFSILDGDDRPPILDEMASAAFSLGATKGSAYFALAPGASLRPRLRPGRDCGEFLTRFEKPLAAFTLSCDEPARIVIDAFARLAPREVDEMLEALHEAGTSRRELNDLFRQGAGGVLLYPSTHQWMPVQFVAFFRTQNRDRLINLIQTSIGEQAARHDHGDQVWFVHDGNEYVGVVADYLVIGEGTVPKLVEKSSWQTELGGREFLAGEMDLRSFLETVAGDDREVRGVLRGLPDGDATARAKVTLRSGGLLAEVTWPQFSVAGAIKGLVTQGRENRLQSAKQAKATHDIRSLLTASELFKLDVGRWPESVEELMNPSADPDGRSRKYLQRLPKDPWTQEPYFYEVTEKGIRIYSYGADMREGGEGPDADIFSDRD